MKPSQICGGFSFFLSTLVDNGVPWLGRGTPSFFTPEH